ncbi:MAG TPA: glycosyltransferase family A protein [Devosia sp.]|nr:glycosyltransferase family A protein [Devosia sp.]
MIRHSVVIPAFNAVRHVGEAIGSARAQLGPDDELIVVDNGSTDGTLDVLAPLAANGGIQLLHETKRGPAAARNRGMREARGRIISFLDADDLWPAGRQDGMIDCLDADASADAVYGRISVTFDAMPEGRLAAERVRFLPIEGTHAPLIGLGIYTFRRELLERTGEQNEAIMMGEDTDYLLRLRAAGMNCATYGGLALVYRRHERNMTRDPKDVGAATMGLILRGLRRRRGEND